MIAKSSGIQGGSRFSILYEQKRLNKISGLKSNIGPIIYLIKS